MNDSCPICPHGVCRGYPHLWRRLREDPERWKQVHDQVNGLVPAVAIVPVADAIRATKLGFHNCWFSTKDSECGCSGLRCHLKDRIVTLADCIACLRN